jgi:serine/threonine-protein kinase
MQAMTTDEEQSTRGLIGSVLSGRYTIERLLGEGAMGAVYAAEHTLMRKRVAVKVLHPSMMRNPEVVARFEREAISASHIDHPNVAAATDFGKLDDGSFFLVLEYVEGKSLRDMLEPGRFEIGRALHVTRQLANALVRAHGLGIVHRDLKPENVMLVAREGEPDFVKVLDFGIAKVPVGEMVQDTDAAAGAAPAGPALTQLGMVYGTPEYMAPEQALGLAIDARADLYALGVMLYEMLTGERPFVSDSPIALLGMQVNSPPPPMSEKAPEAAIPPDVEALVNRLLAKEPDARVQSAKDLVALLPAPNVPPPAPSSAVAFAPAATSHAGASQQVRVPRPVGVLLRGLHGLPRPAVLAGLGSLVLLALLVVLVSVVAGRTPAKAEGTAPEASSSAATLASAKAELQSRMKKADERRAQASAQAADGRWAECMRTVGAWIAEQPEIADDAKVRAMVHDAALSDDEVASTLAFVQLERHMGQPGLDDLYDIAYGGGKRVQTSTRDRARKALREPDVRALMSPALAVTVDVLSAGHSCKVKELFPRAQSDGDARTVAALKPLAARLPAGLFGINDGLACIHEGSLGKTIAAIEARTK